MYNNAAILTSVNNDNVEILEKEWEPQRQKFIKRYGPYFVRMMFEDLTPYFQDFFLNVANELRLDTSQINRIEGFNTWYNDPKIKKVDSIKYTSRIHIDTERNVAISIPIYAISPVIFYDHDQITDTNYKKFIVKKPNQTITYSFKHPTLLNTKNFHQVFYLNENEHRAVLQMNCMESFDNLVRRNVDKVVVL